MTHEVPGGLERSPYDAHFAAQSKKKPGIWERAGMRNRTRMAGGCRGAGKAMSARASLAREVGVDAGEDGGACLELPAFEEDPLEPVQTGEQHAAGVEGGDELPLDGRERGNSPGRPPGPAVQPASSSPTRLPSRRETSAATFSGRRAPKSIRAVTSSPSKSTWSCQMSRMQGVSGTRWVIARLSVGGDARRGAGEEVQEPVGPLGQFGPHRGLDAKPQAGQAALLKLLAVGPTAGEGRGRGRCGIGQGKARWPRDGTGPMRSSPRASAAAWDARGSRPAPASRESVPTSVLRVDEPAVPASFQRQRDKRKVLPDERARARPG